MGKLVRDRIPEIILAEGRRPITKTLADAEYLAALLEKLSEEVGELRTAPPDKRLGEAADVHEVLLALLALSGLTEDDLLAAAAAKRSSRGGFEKGIWLDSE